MGDLYPTVRVAAIQASPVFLDREATTQKACRLIREAGAGGARVIVFPEGFLPAHPVWYHFHPGTGPVAIGLSVALFKNAVEIPGPEVAALAEAAGDAGAYVMMGLCEKRPQTDGTMYNTQLYLGPDGRLIGKHQKFMPTVGERYVHALGAADTFGTFPSAFGPLSGLLCSENSNPLAVFALAAEGTRIHGAAWPNHWSKLQKSMKEYVAIATLSFAQAAKCFVVSACGTVDEAMIAGLQLTAEEEEILRQPDYAGGSMIAAPNGKLIAGPLGREEGILYADLDLELCVRHKLEHDFTGHYNRPDMFQLKVSRRTPRLYQREEAGGEPAPPSEPPEQIAADSGEDRPPWIR